LRDGQLAVVETCEKRVEDVGGSVENVRGSENRTAARKAIKKKKPLESFYRL